MSSSNYIILFLDTHSNMEECISNVAVLFEVGELYRVVEPEDLVDFLQNGSITIETHNVHILSTVKFSPEY